MLWSECASTATKLQNITAEADSSAHQKYYGSQPNYARHLKVFGEIGIYKDNSKRKRPKLENKGKYRMLLGYADNHAGDVFRMLNLSTNKVIVTQDITWTQKMYGDHIGLKRSKYRETVLKLMMEPNDDDEDDTSTNTEEENTEVKKQPKETNTLEESRTDGQQLPREVKNLQTFFNQNPGELAEVALEAALLGATDSGYTEPKTFREGLESSGQRNKGQMAGSYTP